MALTPRDWLQLRQDLLVRQDLAISTVKDTVRTLRRLEREGLDLQRPQRDVYERIIARKKAQGARGTALASMHKAVRRLLRTRGRRWPDLQAPKIPQPDIVIPPDHVVHGLMRYGVGTAREHDVQSRLFRFCVQMGHYLALRAPSEHLSLQLGDFDAVSSTLRVYASKTGRTRTIPLEPWLCQLLEDYVHGLRAELLGSRDVRAFLVSPKGQPWRPEYYRMWLMRRAKPIWSRWSPYSMRHWGATYWLLQCDLDVLPVKYVLGHAQLSTTERYLHVAERILHDQLRRHAFKPLHQNADERAPA